MKLRISANHITALRMAGTVCMAFTKPFSVCFYIVYTICGISDVLDGFVARLTKTSSEFGAKLDSVADLMFYAVMIIKIFPVLLASLPRRIWYAVIFILALRILSYTIAAVKFRKFASLHTYLNKFTGFTTFIVPYFALSRSITAVCTVTCIVAIISTFEELFIHLTSSSYPVSRKTVIYKHKNIQKK